MPVGGCPNDTSAAGKGMAGITRPRLPRLGTQTARRCRFCSGRDGARAARPQNLPGRRSRRVAVKPSRTTPAHTGWGTDRKGGGARGADPRVRSGRSVIWVLPRPLNTGWPPWRLGPCKKDWPGRSSWAPWGYLAVDNHQTRRALRFFTRSRRRRQRGGKTRGDRRWCRVSRTRRCVCLGQAWL